MEIQLNVQFLKYEREEPLCPSKIKADPSENSVLQVLIKSGTCSSFVKKSNVIAPEICQFLAIKSHPDLADRNLFRRFGSFLVKNGKERGPYVNSVRTHMNEDLRRFLKS